MKYTQAHRDSTKKRHIWNEVILYILILHRDIPKVEDIMPALQKGIYCMIPLKQGAESPQIHRHRGQGGGMQGRGRGQELVFKGRS